MNKLQFMRLWDTYHGLLTPTQQEITNLYFNLDLTVTEIAESKGITRQGVSECLLSCKKQLAEFEQKLGLEKILSENGLARTRLVKDVVVWAEEFLKLHPEYAADIARLTDLLDQDDAADKQTAFK